LLIIYHSQGGNTRRLAEAVADGAGEIEGLAVQVRTAQQITSEAGNDGSGALQSIERICTGFQFKKVQTPVMTRGPIDETGLETCRELGRTMAAGLEAGIF
jgi:hypothetical protein